MTVWHRVDRTWGSGSTTVQGPEAGNAAWLTRWRRPGLERGRPAPAALVSEDLATRTRLRGRA